LNLNKLLNPNPPLEIGVQTLNHPTKLGVPWKR